MGRGHVANSNWSFANISQENRDFSSRFFFFNYRILPIFGEFGRRSEIWDEIIASANILILDWWDT